MDRELSVPDSRVDVSDSEGLSESARVARLCAVKDVLIYVSCDDLDESVAGLSADMQGALAELVGDDLTVLDSCQDGGTNAWDSIAKLMGCSILTSNYNIALIEQNVALFLALATRPDMVAHMVGQDGFIDGVKVVLSDFYNEPERLLRLSKTECSVDGRIQHMNLQGIYKLQALVVSVLEFLVAASEGSAEVYDATRLPNIDVESVFDSFDLPPEDEKSGLRVVLGRIQLGLMEAIKST